MPPPAVTLPPPAVEDAPDAPTPRRRVPLALLAAVAVLLAAALAILIRQPDVPVELRSEPAGAAVGSDDAIDEDSVMASEGSAAERADDDAADASGDAGVSDAADASGDAGVSDAADGAGPAVVAPAHPRDTEASTAPPLTQEPGERPDVAERFDLGPDGRPQAPGPDGRTPSGVDEQERRSAPTSASLRVSYATSDEVLVDRVFVDGPAFVVVREDHRDRPGRVVAHVAVPAGTSEEVAIHLAESPAGDAVWVGLHHDVEEDVHFDFPHSDPPMSQTYQRLPLADQ